MAQTRPLQDAGAVTLVAAMIRRAPVPDEDLAVREATMPYVPTGGGAFGFSLNWEKVPGDEDIARRVVIFLEDRRLLFGERHSKDELHCVHSAIDIRKFLTQELTNAKPGKSLDRSLRAIRAACRNFVEAAGPDARNFRYHYGHQTDRFSLALGELHSLVGLHLAAIANQYDIEIEDDLALEAILSSADYDADTAERWGWVTRALPDAELDAFVDATAARLASFDRQALATAKAMVNRATLPPDADLVTAYGEFADSLTQPGFLTRAAALGALAADKGLDVEYQLGEYLGLANQTP